MLYWMVFRSKICRWKISALWHTIFLKKQSFKSTNILMAIITKTVYLNFFCYQLVLRNSQTWFLLFQLLVCFCLYMKYFIFFFYENLNTNESIMSLSSQLIIIQFPTYSNTYDINAGKKDMISNDRQISQP